MSVAINDKTKNESSFMSLVIHGASGYNYALVLGYTKSLRESLFNRNNISVVYTGPDIEEAYRAFHNCHYPVCGLHQLVEALSKRHLC